MPTVNPDIRPLGWVPVLPGEPGDTMGQGYFRKCCVIAPRFLGGRVEFSAEQPVPIQVDGPVGRAGWPCLSARDGTAASQYGAGGQRQSTESAALNEISA